MGEISLPFLSCCWSPASDRDLGRCRKFQVGLYLVCEPHQVQESPTTLQGWSQTELQRSLLEGLKVVSCWGKSPKNCPWNALLTLCLHPGSWISQASPTGQLGIAECHPGHVQAVPTFGCWVLWSVEEGVRFLSWSLSGCKLGWWLSFLGSQLCSGFVYCPWFVYWSWMDVICTQNLSIRAAGLLIDLVGCLARHLGLS